MKDQYDRTIDYLRISITDRCNLRCRYCMPRGIRQIPMRDLLTYEEIAEVVSIAAELGIHKIKITGGEPLVRPECTKLIAMLKKIKGIEQVTMTTNGVLLSGYADDLKKAGLDAVNVSLDTLHPEIFRQITGFDSLQKVLDGIHASMDAGIPTKINTVLQKDMNADEWPELLKCAENYPLDVRFIEMMPIGYGRQFAVISNDVLKERILQVYPDAYEDKAKHGNGPAVYIHIPGFQGSIGFISAIHGKFCFSCNRIRMTSTGKIKPCLCYDSMADLRDILRSSGSDRRETLKQILAETIYSKPKAHCFETLASITEKQEMIEIGG